MYKENEYVSKVHTLIVSRVINAKTALPKYSNNFLFLDGYKI